jgi:hypothetical protein
MARLLHGDFQESGGGSAIDEITAHNFRNLAAIKTVLTSKGISL